MIRRPSNLARMVAFLFIATSQIGMSYSGGKCVFRLRYHVAARRLAEPRSTCLRRALLRLEVHVHQPEAVAEAKGPLEVVHRAPLEVALDRHAVGSGALELRQVG